MTASAAVPERRRVDGDSDRMCEVIDAAAAVFHEKGYAAASMQDIAERLGILKGSLYYYIKSKDDLLYWVIRGQHRMYAEQIASVERLPGPALARLRRFVLQHLRVVTRDIQRSVVFFRDFHHLTGKRRSEILADRARYEAGLVQLIAAGHADGSIAAAVEPKATALALLGMLNWAYVWFDPSGVWSVEDVARRFTTLLIDGLGAPATATPQHPRCGAT